MQQTLITIHINYNNGLGLLKLKLLTLWLCFNYFFEQWWSHVELMHWYLYLCDVECPGRWLDHPCCSLTQLCCWLLLVLRLSAVSSSKLPRHVSFDLVWWPWTSILECNLALEWVVYAISEKCCRCFRYVLLLLVIFVTWFGTEFTCAALCQWYVYNHRGIYTWIEYGW